MSVERELWAVERGYYIQTLLWYVLEVVEGWGVR